MFRLRFWFHIFCRLIVFIIVHFLSLLSLLLLLSQLVCYHRHCLSLTNTHTQVPLLESNAEENWVFDVLAKKTLVNKLFTTMSGSVVTSSSEKKGTKRRAKTDDKENVNGNKRAKAKAKPKAKANAMPSLPMTQEQHVQDTTVACAVGVRNKLWIDDLLNCVDYVTASITHLCGDASVKQWLKPYLIRLGLLFAFNGSVVLETSKGTKQYKKWSQLRPALIDHGILSAIQAGLRRNIF